MAQATPVNDLTSAFRDAMLGSAAAGATTAAHGCIWCHVVSDIKGCDAHPSPRRPSRHHLSPPPRQPSGRRRSCGSCPAPCAPAVQPSNGYRSASITTGYTQTVAPLSLQELHYFSDTQASGSHGEAYQLLLDGLQRGVRLQHLTADVEWQRVRVHQAHQPPQVPVLRGQTPVSAVSVYHILVALWRFADTWPCQWLAVQASCGAQWARITQAKERPRSLRAAVCAHLGMRSSKSSEMKTRRTYSLMLFFFW